MRTIAEIRATGAAWVAESELEWLCEQYEVLKQERDLLAALDEIEPVAELRAERDGLKEQLEALRSGLLGIAYGMDYDPNGKEQFNHPARTREVARAILEAVSNPARGKPC